MSIIQDAVKELEQRLQDSGCESGVVTLGVNYEAEMCQYPKGVCMEAEFGGRCGEFVTSDPLRAKTRVSFMFGAPLTDPKQRGAACAIMNGVSAFLCMARRLHACTPDCYRQCRTDLAGEIAGRKIYCVGSNYVVEETMKEYLTDDPSEADIFLITGQGLVSDEGLAVIDAFRGEKRMIFLGPSASGVSALLNLEHWCPYGR